jgi:hypothetical protein
MTIKDPRIKALKLSGIPDGSYLQEDLYAGFSDKNV